MATSTFLLLIGACETPSSKKPIFSPNESFKAYCIFKDSSFWVYEDSTTLETDTQQMFNGRWDLSVNTPMSFRENAFSVRFKSTYYKNEVGMVTRVIEENSSVFEQSGNGAILFSSDFTINKKQFFFNNGFYRVDKLFDSLKVNNKIYKDVILVSTESNSYAFKQKTIYWSRHIGIVKYKTSDGHTWVLVKYILKQ